MTHTYAIMEVSQKAYDEIRGKLEAAGYSDQIDQDGSLDMHGIALAVEDVPKIKKAVRHGYARTSESQDMCGISECLCGFSAQSLQKHFDELGIDPPHYVQTEDDIYDRGGFLDESKI